MKLVGFCFLTRDDSVEYIFEFLVATVCFSQVTSRNSVVRYFIEEQQSQSC